MSEMMAGKSRWRGPLPLAAILVLALALRLIGIQGRPLWYDEAFSILYSEKSLETMIGGTVGTGSVAADVHPLLYYAGLHSWMGLAGRSPVAARTLSVLLGTATVGVLFVLAQGLFGRRAALLAAAVTALSPFHIYYSQEARMYALLGLGALATVTFFARAWAGGGWRHWLAFSLAGAVTLYAHNLGSLFLLSLDLWILWRWLRDRRPRHLRSVILSHFLMLLLFAPWLTIVPLQVGKVSEAYWVTQPGLAELVQTGLVFHFAYDNQALPAALLAPALLFTLLIPALLVLEGLRGRLAGSRQAPSAQTVSLLLFLSVGPPLLVLLVSLAQPIYVIRALLPSALIYYVLVARLLASDRLPHALQWGVWGPALVIVALSLVNHYSYEQFPRAPFSEATAQVEEDGESTVVVHSNKLTFLPMYYADPALEQRFIADEPGSATDTLGDTTQEALGIRESADLAEATAGHERITFVIFRQAVAEFEEVGEEHPHLEWLRRRYEVVEKREFADLWLYSFESR